MKKLLALPTANLDVENRVPLVTLEKIADAHAFEVWGEDIDRGKPFPVADETGAVYAYVFSYIRGSRQFPGYGKIFDDIRDLWSRYREAAVAENTMPSEFYSELTRMGEKFGSIYVSARRTNFPVLRVSHFLHPYFLVGEVAQQEANRKLDREDVRLERVYYLAPNEQYLEFTSQGDRVLIDANSVERRVPDTALTREPAGPVDSELLQKIDDAWERIKAPSPMDGRRHEELFPGELVSPGAQELLREPEGTSEDIIDVAPIALDANEISRIHTVKKIAYWELIPKVDHTPSHWCAVSSKAMVLGFYDNFVKGKGTLAGFGRLIDYWFEYSPGGYNLPNLIDEVLPGKDVFKINNYSCKWTETKANSSNGYAWNTLKAEIDAGRPAFFSISGHTTAAFGYRIDSKGEKYAIVYDPPNPSVPTYVNEYHYTSCIGVGAVTLKGASNGDHLIIWSPDSGETFNTADPAAITWFVWGNKIKKTTLSYSKDGGNTWIKVASNIPTKGAWNMFVWFPDKTATKARVHVQGYTDKNKLIAADGTQNNFSITAKKFSGYHNLLHKHSGKYICTGDKNNGGNIHIWGPIPSGHENRYKCKFISCGDGYYYLLHKHSGKYICTGDKNNGGNIHIWGPIPSGHEDRYKFMMIPTLDGYYYFLHKYSGKFVCTGDKDNGGNIHTWGPIPSGHENRYKFKINPAS